jgi:SAM-dependent methyltransferase
METEPVKLSCTKCDQADYKFWGKEFTGIEMVNCQKCSLKFVSPRKSEEEIDDVYGDHYWPIFEGGVKDVRSNKNYFNYDIISLIKVLEYSQHKSPKILDIGVGEGGFLKGAKLMGFDDLTGNDINDARINELKKFDIKLIVGDITTTDVGTYDIINAQHVLEHVLDPFKFLNAVKKALKPDGLAHIAIPNEGGVVAVWKSTLSRLGLKRSAFIHLSPFHHLFFFNQKSFRFVLEEAGFQILYLGTRNNIKDKGVLYELIHKLLDKLKWNTHLEVVVKAKV